jgi:hypothetical protein
MKLLVVDSQRKTDSGIKFKVVTGGRGSISIEGSTTVDDYEIKVIPLSRGGLASLLKPFLYAKQDYVEVLTPEPAPVYRQEIPRTDSRSQVPNGGETSITPPSNVVSKTNGPIVDLNLPIGITVILELNVPIDILPSGTELQATRAIVGGAPTWLIKAPSGEEVECKDTDLSKSIILRGQEGGVRLVREVLKIVVEEEKANDETVVQGGHFFPCQLSQ